MHVHLLVWLKDIKRIRLNLLRAEIRLNLMRYVTSYVSKWHDSFQSDSLYSVHVGPYQAAYKHLICMKPLEPKMWLSLSSTKMSWTPSRRKKLSFHCVESILNNPAYMKYLRRSSNHSNLSFLQWLRLVDEKKGIEHKTGTTLVGVNGVDVQRFLFLPTSFTQPSTLRYPTAISHRT